MSRRKKVASLAFTGAAAAAALGMQAGTAFAVAGTWKISAPKGTPYHGAFDGKATGAGTTLVDSKHTSFPLTCTSATATGSLPHSTVTGTTATTTIGTIKTAAFNHCSFDGVTFKAKLTKTGNLRATTYNKTTGITKGTITAVTAALSGSGNSCHATVTGTVSASYVNGKHDLVVGKGHKATLTIHNPTAGCLILGNGDHAYFTATYAVSTPKSLHLTGP
jgi:ribosomal protein S8E